MRDELFISLKNHLNRNHNSFFITADLGFGLVEQIKNDIGQRFLNVGVAEQSMISVAAGLAHSGAEVFCYSLGNFPTMRPLDQLRNLVCYHNLNVNILASGCGFSYGQLGYTHHAVEDIGVISSLSNIRIFSPSSVDEMECSFGEMSKTNGPTYLRLDRSYRAVPEPLETSRYQIYGPRALSGTGGVGIFAYGGMVCEALELKSQLNALGKEATVYSCVALTHMDEDLYAEAMFKHSELVTMEENNSTTGLGAKIRKVLTERDITGKKLRCFGINPNNLALVGDQKYLRRMHDLNADGIKGFLQREGWL